MNELVRLQSCSFTECLAAQLTHEVLYTYRHRHAHAKHDAIHRSFSHRKFKR